MYWLLPVWRFKSNIFVSAVSNYSFFSVFWLDLSWEKFIWKPIILEYTGQRLRKKMSENTLGLGRLRLLSWHTWAALTLQGMLYYCMLSPLVPAPHLKRKTSVACCQCWAGPALQKVLERLGWFVIQEQYCGLTEWPRLLTADTSVRCGPLPGGTSHIFNEWMWRKFDKIHICGEVNLHFQQIGWDLAWAAGYKNQMICWTAAGDLPRSGKLNRLDIEH